SFLFGSFAIFRLRLGKGIKALSEFYGYFSEYSSQKALLIKTLMLSCAIQVMAILSMYIIARGLGQHIYLSYFFIFFPIIVTISTLPISISGIGLREGAFVLLFGMAGVKPEMATAMSFAWFLSTASGGLVGLFEYLRLKT
ncbi:MAG: lysylphosphatidylglycerol synthase domain-containing protein, partial [Nitrospirota bacterium]